MIDSYVASYFFLQKAGDEITSPAFSSHGKSLPMAPETFRGSQTTVRFRCTDQVLVAAASAVVVSASESVVSAKSAAAEQKEDDPQAVVIAAEAASAVAVAADAG